MTHALPRRPAWLVTALVIGTFLLLDHDPYRLYEAVMPEARGWTRLAGVGALRWLPWVLVPLVVTALLAGPGHAPAALGLRGAPLRALALAVALTAVLPLTYALTGELVLTEERLRVFLDFALFAGVAEEVLYRGLLFGLLFRLAGWGFLPAALLNTAIFGLGHVAQGEGLAEAAGILAITGIGAFWFSWLYAEWDDLWVPIWLHVLMNGWWIVFEVADTALGPAQSWAARAAVIALSIGITLATARRRGGLAVRGRAWLRGGPAPRQRWHRPQ